MELPPDFRDLICEFNNAGVEYLVIGGYAVGAHGCPRATGDLDLYFRRTADNTQRIIAALRSFGYSSADLTADSLMEPNMVHYFGRIPLRVDLLNTLSAVDFDEAWKNRVTRRISDVDIPVIGVKALIANKRAAGRYKDLADAENLEALKSDQEE